MYIPCPLLTFTGTDKDISQRAQAITVHGHTLSYSLLSLTQTATSSEPPSFLTDLLSGELRVSFGQGTGERKR